MMYFAIWEQIADCDWNTYAYIVENERNHIYNANITQFIAFDVISPLHSVLTYIDKDRLSVWEWLDDGNKLLWCDQFVTMIINMIIWC